MLTLSVAGNRWHIECFCCNTCGTLLDSDANLLLLGDGSLICNSCTYSCSACGNKIEDLAILTGDQAFCANCFRCRNCKGKIENLRYARTSQGIFCMACHESLMARRRKKAREAKSSANNSNNSTPAVLDKSLPALPPNAASNRQNSSGTPDGDTPSDSYVATPSETSPKVKSHAHKRPSPETSKRDYSPVTRKRDYSPASVNGIRKGQCINGSLPVSFIMCADNTIGSLPPSIKSARDKRHSTIIQASDDGDTTAYLPISFDPTSPSHGSLPTNSDQLLDSGKISSVGGPETSDEIPERKHQTILGERNPVSSRSSSTDRVSLNATSKVSGSPHIAYQEKRRQNSQDVLDTIRKRKDPIAPVPATSTTNLSTGRSVSHASTEACPPAHNVEGFKLQEAPRPKRSTAAAKITSPGSIASSDFTTPSLDNSTDQTTSSPGLTRSSSPTERTHPQLNNKPFKALRNHGDLPARKGSLIAANLPDSLQTSSHKVDPSTQSLPQSATSVLSGIGLGQKPSLTSGRAVTDTNVPRLSDGRVVSKPMESPAAKSFLDPPISLDPPGPRSPGVHQIAPAPDAFATPRLPPMPPTPATDRPNTNDSISMITSDMFKSMDAPLSPLTSLPRYGLAGDALNDEELSRIIRGEEGHENSSSVLRRVSNAVSKHGRSFSDRGSRSSSGHKWKPPANGSIDISSPTSIASPGSKEETLLLKNQLLRAQQRVTELEAEKNMIQDHVNGSVEIKQVTTELKEKRSTVAFLDTQREMVVRELEVMTEHLTRAKDSNRPLNLDALKSDILRDFAISLQKLKDTLGSQIEDLVHRRNELTDEITKLIEMKDKGFHEYESISAKNTQLYELNNQLVQNIQDQMLKAGRPTNGSSLDCDRPNVNALGIYTNGKDKSDMSIDVRSVDSGDLSYAQMTPDQEIESPAVLSTPKVIDVRKGQLKKFNWKKGGQVVAKNVSKGLNRAFMSGNNQYPQSPRDIQQTPDGIAYMSMSGPDPGFNAPKSAMDPSRSGFGLFGQKNMPQKGSHLRSMQNGNNSSLNLSVQDSSG